jgi:aspartate/methionine/tyrosine aminotransferase
VTGVDTNYSEQQVFWRGRFPKSPLSDLLDVDRRHNLAESTCRDLTVGEVLDLVGTSSELRGLALGYGASAGLLELREVLAGAYGIPTDWVITTHGTALGLLLLAMELCRPGDEAVLVRPSFPPSRDTLAGSGAALIEVPLKFSDSYRFDVARIAAVLSPKTKLVSIASPQNPNGITITHSAIIELLAAMAACAPDAWLFVDETYREAVYGNNPVPPSAATLSPRVITGASISKAHGAPGLRVGWLTVPDGTLRQRLISAKINTIVSCSVLNEALAAKLLAKAAAITAPRRRLLLQALDILARWHSTEQQRLDWVRPHAGALCCLRLKPDVFDAAGVERFWAALPASSVQLAPGSWFGEEQRVFRLGFGYLPLARLEGALAALSETIDGVVA